MAESHTSVRGQAYAPGTSRLIAAELKRNGVEILLCDAAGEILTRGAPIDHETGPAGRDVLSFADGMRFETTDRDGLRALGVIASDGWLAGLEGWHPRLALVIVACLLGAIAIWRWGLDLLVALAILATPAPLVTSMDRGNMLMIDRTMAEESALSEARQAEIREIFATLSAVAPEAPYGSYRLEFRDIEEMGPNAFALPGGTIVVTDALVEQFGDEDILAGVLGHEMAHISERHSLRQLYRSLSVYVLIGMMAGDVGPVLEDLILDGGVVLSLAYSRAHERVADDIGVRTAEAAGYDGAALAGFFDELDRRYGGLAPEWMSTHPDSAERAARIRERP
ncbi:M48 family metallopeptidase [uncultured Celeribacter sp.]|uniref:M48 family metallopeptidase n=1 Tax=uncultured Celeribacter sp. TaxID=1303376 RepID=UPI002AA6A55C|nr:M48 family metallopeptidase [uncultured Celeribacter sp.]